MTAARYIITAAAVSTLLVGAAANAPSINSIVASSSKGFFGVHDSSIRQGWNIATSVRGGSTGKSPSLNYVVTFSSTKANV